MLNHHASATILYLDHAPIWGGAEAVLVNLLSQLDRGRFRPLVGAPSGSPLVGPLEAYNIPWTPVMFGQLNRAGVLLPLNLVQSIWQVMRIVRRERVAVIHTNTVRAHIVGSLAGALTTVPVVWTIHDNTLPRRVARSLSSIPRKVIAVSTWLKDVYGPLGLAHKTSVIFNGIRTNTPLIEAGDLRVELGVPVDAPLVLFVGRLIAGKAPHLFVRAAQIVSIHCPNAYFVLVGGPDQVEPGQTPSTYPNELEQCVQESTLGRKLIMTGHRSDVTRFYAAADAFVYTSIQPEGLPTVLLEAMRYAVPTIATQIGGATEIVQDGITGLCVPPNEVASLATAVTKVLSDHTYAQTLGQAGRARLERDFDLQSQVTNTTQLYDQLLKDVHG